MTRCVPRRRYDRDPGRHTHTSGDGHVGELWDVPVHAREVRLPLGECEVVALHDERGLRERAVVAGVIEMQMAIYDDGHVVRANAERLQTRDDGVLPGHDDLEAARAKGRVRPLDMDRMKPGVEDYVALRRAQQCRPHGNEGLLIGRPRHECRGPYLDSTGTKDR